jgi:hypothetical protein
MPHLIAPLGGITIDECVAQLSSAHDCLVTAAQEMLAHANEIEADYWGSDFKRLQVRLPSPRPAILQQSTHNFGEVVNQVAGLERLLDGLRWFATERPQAHVVSCHPSTSSAPGDNDVILSQAEEMFRIEVFDIAGSKMTNNKLHTTLQTFGLETGWVSGRLLVFVSASVAPRVAPLTRGLGRFHFASLHQGERTHVLELLHD